MAVLTMHFGPFLTPTELVVLCAAHSSLWRNSAAFVGWLAAAQHGTDAHAVADFGKLKELDQIPRAYILEFTSPKFLVESGVCLTSKLQRGSYRVSIADLQNPNLGTLDLLLDDVCVTDHSKLAADSHEPAKHNNFPAFDVEIEKTGRHVWRFETRYRDGHSPSDSMRLKEFKVERICRAEARRVRAIAWLRSVAHQTATAARTRISHLLSFPESV